jgi:hypothetical protein
MAKRFVVDFDTTQYVTMVVEAEDRDDVEGIIDRLFDNEDFLYDLQAQMVNKMRDQACFGENTECTVAFEASGGWLDVPVANDYLK